MDQTKYLYEVRPTRPPRIPGRRPTMTRQSLLLTKDEVKEYMKFGTVYRKSSSGNLMKVTGENLNSLHKDIDTITENAKKETTVSIPAAPKQEETKNNYQNNNQYGVNKNKHHNRHDDRGKSSVNNEVPSIAYPTQDNSGNDESPATGNSIEVNL